MSLRPRIPAAAFHHPIVHVGFILAGTAFGIFALAVMVIYGGDHSRYSAVAAAFWIGLGQFIGQDLRYAKSSVISSYFGIIWALVTLCIFIAGY